MRRGSALIVALWVIAILSVMVLSFAMEAKSQSGINVFVRERNRVSRLIEPGKILAEVVLLGYGEVKDWTEDQDNAELLEDDRWYLEKQDLKEGRPCRIGPILVDEENPESGTVSVEISIVRKINVNELFQGSDQNYRVRWEMILTSHGIPEDFEVEAWDASHARRTKFKLIDLLIASWNDWRDEDDTPTAGEEGDECGAESKYYEEEYESIKLDDEYKRYPRNSSIPDVKELGYVRGFRDYPAILTGGVLNPEASKDEQITVTGIADMFGTTGTAKLNINDPKLSVEEILTIPGIYSEEDDDEAQESGRQKAEAILKAHEVKPDYDVDETLTWWPFRDWKDVCDRIERGDADCDDIGQEAAQYFVYKPDETTLFDITITCASMGMERKVRAKAYVKDKDVRYVEWEEDPKETKEN